jgi:hypothetical protein
VDGPPYPPRPIVEAAPPGARKGRRLRMGSKSHEHASFLPTTIGRVSTRIYVKREGKLMLLTFQRDDHVCVRVNTDYIVYVYPQGNQPSNPAVLVLSTGDKLKLKDSYTDLFNRPEFKKLTSD